MGLLLVGLCALGCDPSPTVFGAGHQEPPPQGEPPPTETPVETGAVIADDRPPPISGGSMHITTDGDLAVLADPDRDRVMLVDLETHDSQQIELLPGDEPGRVIEVEDTFYVALRGGGAIVSIDRQTATLTARRSICGAPRGLVHEPIADEIFVACAGGELVAVGRDLGNENIMRRRQLDRDLRDIVPVANGFLISRFRSAELLHVDYDGAVLGRLTLPEYEHPNGIRFAPGVAWRLQVLPDGSVAVLHQRSRLAPIVMTEPAQTVDPYYASVDCGAALSHAALTVVHLADIAQPTGVVLRGGASEMPLAVDVAISPDGLRAAVMSAGSNLVREAPVDSYDKHDGCSDNGQHFRMLNGSAEQIAAGYRANGELVVQVREPASIVVFGSVSGVPEDIISLPGASVEDTGHSMFHKPPMTGALACASCHPEGRDDGHTWMFDPIGLRRTQALDHGLEGTAPFHWDGDLDDFRALMDEVYSFRLGGMLQGDDRVAALASWIEQIGRIPQTPGQDQAQVDRGRALFVAPETGCADCHHGALLTNNATVDVGTGRSVQVPSLIGIANRGPFMHDGCAPTLHDRFGPCGGGDDHGTTSNLSAQDIDDLVAYLETL